MKKLLWVTKFANVEFNLNWFEYLIVSRILGNKKSCKIFKDYPKGESIDTVYIDEVANIK